MIMLRTLIMKTRVRINGTICSWLGNTCINKCRFSPREKSQRFSVVFHFILFRANCYFINRFISKAIIIYRWFDRCFGNSYIFVNLLTIYPCAYKMGVSKMNRYQKKGGMENEPKRRYCRSRHSYYCRNYLIVVTSCFRWQYSLYRFNWNSTNFDSYF